MSDYLPTYAKRCLVKDLSQGSSLSRVQESSHPVLFLGRKIRHCWQRSTVECRMLNKDKYNRKAETTNLKINKGCKGGQLIAKLGFANTFHD